jgi:hypothetical protein
MTKEKRFYNIDAEQAEEEEEEDTKLNGSSLGVRPIER